MKDGSKTYIGSKGHGLLWFPAARDGIPALRLVQAHSPDLRIECEDARGSPVVVPLGELDISHETILVLNPKHADTLNPLQSGVYSVDPARIDQIAAAARH